jgi:hypothetical protein
VGAYRGVLVCVCVCPLCVWGGAVQRARRVQAVVVGPKVVASMEEMHFGKVQCLVDVARTLSLHNASLIPAPFKTFIKTTRSKFKVDVLEGVLAPDERVTLTIVANLDDALPHKDELHVVVTDGDNLAVILKAVGTGTTLHCDHDVSTVDFGHVFTSNVCEQSFVMENKGRRVQSIQWINATLRDAEAEERRRVCGAFNPVCLHCAAALRAARLAVSGCFLP